MSGTIVASSGGFVGTGLWGVMRPGRIFQRALEFPVTSVLACYSS